VDESNLSQVSALESGWDVWSVSRLSLLCQ
ncbi:unnamed protein product, partial [marine sediment metagenome]